MNNSLSKDSTFHCLPVSFAILRCVTICCCLFCFCMLSAQTDSLRLSTIDINKPLTSVIKVSNETACDMSLYCYEIDGEEILLNMGTLASGRSATIRPRSELGRLYTKNPLTDEETGSVYFFGGDFELRVSDGCEPDLTLDSLNVVDSVGYDCADLMANVGDSCNDGIKSTLDDKITASCTCEGTRVDPITSDCDSVSILAVGDFIIVSNLNKEQINSVQVLTINWKPIFTCAGNCEDTETIYAPRDSFRVKVSYYSKSWAHVCTVWGEIPTRNNFTIDDIASSRTRSIITSSNQLSTWEVYPNPVQTALTVTVANNLSGSIRLSNLNGQLIEEVVLSSLVQSTWQLDMSTLENGMYLLQLKTADGEVQTRKIVVNK